MHPYEGLWPCTFFGEVDDELGVSLDDDMLDAECDGSLEAADESFVLRDVI